MKTMNSERGDTFIEILIALVLISLVVLSTFGALAVGTKALLQSEMRTKARSITVSQMETVLNAAYINAPANGVADYGSPPSYQGYDIYTIGRDGTTLIKNKIYGVPWDITTNGVASPSDTGMQKVTVIIKYASTGQEIFRLVDFKVKK